MRPRNTLPLPFATIRVSSRYAMSCCWSSCLARSLARQTGILRYRSVLTIVPCAGAIAALDVISQRGSSAQRAIPLSSMDRFRAVVFERRNEPATVKYENKAKLAVDKYFARKRTFALTHLSKYVACTCANRRYKFYMRTYIRLFGQAITLNPMNLLC